MEEIIKSNFDKLHSSDKHMQNEAFFYLLDASSEPVDWAYEVWDEMVALLSHKDNHLRAISSQILCNLAQSDPENRMFKDFAALLNVTRDERFVTARHCLQALWRVGLAGEAQQNMLMDGLEKRYHECISEKNCTLIRFDIIQDLRNLYDEVADERIKTKALALIELEDNEKYRKKYAKVWKRM
jgi:hypothetical protein